MLDLTFGGKKLIRKIPEYPGNEATVLANYEAKNRSDQRAFYSFD